MSATHTIDGRPSISPPVTEYGEFKAHVDKPTLRSIRASVILDQVSPEKLHAIRRREDHHRQVAGNGRSADPRYSNYLGSALSSSHILPGKKQGVPDPETGEGT
jgi:hypothetical protein